MPTLLLCWNDERTCVVPLASPNSDTFLCGILLRQRVVKSGQPRSPGLISPPSFFGELISPRFSAFRPPDPHPLISAHQLVNSSTPVLPTSCRSIRMVYN